MKHCKPQFDLGYMAKKYCEDFLGYLKDSIFC